MSKAADAFRTISEVAAELDVPKHVLRFWEAKFAQIRPMKRGGGRRYYRPADLELLRGIRHLLHAEGYTIKGVQKILREQGIDAVKVYSMGSGAAVGQGALQRKASRAEAATAAAGRSKAARDNLERASANSCSVSVPARVNIASILRELEICKTLLANLDVVAEAPKAPRRLRVGGS